jgi:hypothetical protein
MCSYCQHCIRRRSTSGQHVLILSTLHSPNEYFRSTCAHTVNIGFTEEEVLPVNTCSYCQHCIHRMSTSGQHVLILSTLDSPKKKYFRSTRAHTVNIAFTEVVLPVNTCSYCQHCIHRMSTSGQHVLVLSTLHSLNRKYLRRGDPLTLRVAIEGFYFQTLQRRHRNLKTRSYDAKLNCGKSSS